MRFYRKEIPDEGDIVFCRTVSRQDDIFYVEILDYDNIQATIPISEMTRRLKSKKFSTLGNEYPAIVTSANNGLIYLSKNKVYRKDIENLTEHYLTCKKITSLGETIYNFYKTMLERKSQVVPDNLFEKVMESSIWKWYDDNDDYLKDEDYTRVFTSICDIIKDLDSDFEEEFRKFINNHVIYTDMEMTSTFTIFTYSEDGVDSIKKLLDSSNYPEHVKIYLKTPPLYCISVVGKDKDQVEKLVKDSEKILLSLFDKKTTKCAVMTSCELTKKPEIIVKSLSIQEINKWFS
jgi:translation initiation factor 2 alpha subunit (eIF-2alpha)